MLFYDDFSPGFFIYLSSVLELTVLNSKGCYNWLLPGMAMLVKIGIVFFALFISLRFHSIKYSVYNADSVNYRYLFPTFHFLPFSAIFYYFLLLSSSCFVLVAIID